MRQVNGEWKGWEQLNYRILGSIDPNSNTGANGTLVHDVLREVGRRTFQNWRWERGIQTNLPMWIDGQLTN